MLFVLAGAAFVYFRALASQREVEHG
jgi:hypothetical protein